MKICRNTCAFKNFETLKCKEETGNWLFHSKFCAFCLCVHINQNKFRTFFSVTFCFTFWIRNLCKTLGVSFYLTAYHMSWEKGFLKYILFVKQWNLDFVMHLIFFRVYEKSWSFIIFIENIFLRNTVKGYLGQTKRWVPKVKISFLRYVLHCTSFPILAFNFSTVKWKKPLL